jgi:uncharacterized protein YjbJ (UPF0337 family)
MNQEQWKGKFHQLKGELKRRWGSLTDDDLTESEGSMEKLMGKIRERSGDSQESIQEWFKSQGVE